MAIVGLVINLALTVLWQMEIISFEDSPPANDLKLYLEAGSRLLQRENLYIWITFTGIASFIVPLPALIIDPNLFIPFILIAILGLYGLILWQLNIKLRKRAFAEIQR